MTLSYEHIKSPVEHSQSFAIIEKDITSAACVISSTYDVTSTVTHEAVTVTGRHGSVITRKAVLV